MNPSLCFTAEFIHRKVLHHTRLGMPSWAAHILNIITACRACLCLAQSRHAPQAGSTQAPSQG